MQLFEICVCNVYRNDECVVGGENIMLDAFPVIEEFQVKHKQHFDT